MKNIKLLVVFLLFSFILTGCAKKTVQVDMNQLSEDSKFHYTNEDLKFSIDLPAEFIYYQTQKKIDAKSTNIEFFVPTSDRDYPQTVSSYGMPLVVKIYSEASWNDLTDKNSLEQVGKNDGKVYVLQFWQQVPKDWQNKWNSNLTKGIKDSFKIK